MYFFKIYFDNLREEEPGSFPLGKSPMHCSGGEQESIRNSGRGRQPARSLLPYDLATASALV